MIVEANLEEAKEIYNKHMLEDFPADELPEYERYLKLTKEKLHNVYLYNKDNQNVAYFIVVEEEKNILITHLAVMKDFRSKGIGKVFLEDIKTFFNDKKLKDELKNLTASSKMLYYILLFVPIIFVFAIYLLDNTYFNSLFTSSLGYLVLILCILLYVSYIFVIKRIMKIGDTL